MISYTFTSKEKDPETSLTYFGSRYYTDSMGRFTSQDPVILSLGSPELEQTTQRSLPEFLSDPQLLNSYSYVRNNPLVAIDSTGEWIENIIGNQNAVLLGNWANNLSANNSVAEYALNHPYQTGAVAGVAGGAVIVGSVLLSGGALTCGVLCGSGVATTATVGTRLGTQEEKIEKATQQGTRLLNGPINITADRLKHVINEHTFGGFETAGKSIFNSHENVVNLVKQGTQQVVEKAKGVNFQRVFDVGRNIGFDRGTGQQTSWLTIITNKAGELITTYPGRP